jgi:hypothetical protein
LGSSQTDGSEFQALSPVSLRPSPRLESLTAQVFALLGTLVGIIMVIIGIGPQTLPDAIYHIAMLIVVVLGIIVFARLQPGGGMRQMGDKR